MYAPLSCSTQQRVSAYQLPFLDKCISVTTAGALAPVGSLRSPVAKGCVAGQAMSEMHTWPL